MLLSYYSLSGKAESFVKKTGMHAVRIGPALRMQQPYVLITSTEETGKMPEEVSDFLIHNHNLMVGCSIIGRYSREELHELSQAVPYISSDSVEKFIKEVNEIERNTAKGYKAQ
ncbi:class Ib ribonucleoside-diphosphate reductase assembly flavoprotein NrdI (plasmid) [Paenibacillus urinalis]|uniref:Class Ib ribonucleoside-diphosphate reductase assembly flavoprotein NrdI n=1 Tax=Paenibacillus urinalis TaxID=521520 RepID=A0ABY7XN43_9BACL|nr:class Ib ribonucleoside-diphosphate reductase assembly flavoprotein NrdI [Paenibacillus urinalis]WDI05070.1 class Ib ribonucleoside-diphosphate reductase assembly flavoprotein NrdI [Paenibacillus urinalis]